MESHFSPTFGAGQAPNPNQAICYWNARSQQYRSVMTRVRSGVIQVTADLHTWDAPNGQQSLIIAVGIVCPNCEYPMIAPAHQSLNFTEDGGLTMATVFACPSHWETVNLQKMPTGRRVRCGWQGVPRGGRFHDPSCPVANPRNPNNRESCSCGAFQSLAE